MTSQPGASAIQQRAYRLRADEFSQPERRISTCSGGKKRSVCIDLGQPTPEFRPSTSTVARPRLSRELANRLPPPGQNRSECVVTSYSKSGARRPIGALSVCVTVDGFVQSLTIGQAIQ